MDLMRLLRSLEEFLYELVGWLVFYPRTFWSVLVHPGAIARYTRLELARDPDDQFKDTLSPVLMLILSVGLAHGMEMMLALPLPRPPTELGRRLFGTDEGLLLSRSAVFCIYALGAAIGTLRRERRPITRDTLREPFSIQAFLACPFVLMLSAGMQMCRAEAEIVRTSGVVLQVLAMGWYVFARARAYHALYQGPWPRIVAAVLLWFAMTTAFVLALVAALVL